MIIIFYPLIAWTLSFWTNCCSCCWWLCISLSRKFTDTGHWFRASNNFPKSDIFMPMHICTKTRSIIFCMVKVWNNIVWLSLLIKLYYIWRFLFTWFIFSPVSVFYRFSWRPFKWLSDIIVFKSNPKMNFKVCYKCCYLGLLISKILQIKLKTFKKVILRFFKLLK